MSSFIANLVIGFIVRQIQKFQQSIDWAIVKRDVDIRVKAIVPGDWLDDEAVLAVNALIDRAAKVLSNSAAIEKIMRLAADEKWADAFNAVVSLLVDGWIATSAPEKDALALVQACEIKTAA